MTEKENRLLSQMVIYAKELKTVYDEEQAKRQELEAANRRLRELDDLKTTFVELVSHELRTPVTVINGYLEVMAEMLAGRLEKQEADFFQLVSDQSRRLGELIEDITNFTHLTRSQALPQPSEQENNLNLVALVKSELHKLAFETEKMQLQIAVELPETIVPANIDPARFRVIISHLLNNAVKFNVQGGWLRLSLKIEGQGDDSGSPKNLRLRISNSGITIPPELIAGMFEAFQQGQATQTRSYNGLGLGLALVQYAIRSFNGEISVKSGVEEGTVFEVKLPYISWQNPEELTQRLQQLQSINLAYAQDLRRLYEAEREKGLALVKLTGDLEEKQKRLNLFLSELLTAQEKERRRVSMDLHDGLAQTLTFAHQMIEMTEVEAPAVYNSKAFSRAKEGLKVARTEVRRLVAGLRPDALDRFGLIPALRDYFATQAKELGWEATFEVIGEFGEPGHSTLEHQIEENLFRIAQEAITNVRKHAESKKVLLKLVRMPEQALLIVQDWGKGFALPNENGSGQSAKSDTLGHFGLIGIEERTRLLGGQIEIQSSPGNGTVLTVQIPLNSC